MKFLSRARRLTWCAVAPVALFTNLSCINSATKLQYDPLKSPASLVARETYNIYVDSMFTSEQMATLQRAIDEWDRVFNGYIRLQVISVDVNSDNTRQLSEVYSKVLSTRKGIMILSLRDNDEINEGYIDGGTLAYVNAIGSSASMMVVLRERISGRNLHKILLHEFGHVFGARHSARSTLMYAYYGEGQPDCVERATALQAANHFDLDVDKLNYCAPK